MARMGAERRPRSAPCDAAGAARRCGRGDKGASGQESRASGLARAEQRRPRGAAGVARVGRGRLANGRRRCGAACSTAGAVGGERLGRGRVSGLAKAKPRRPQGAADVVRVGRERFGERAARARGRVQRCGRSEKGTSGQGAARRALRGRSRGAPRGAAGVARVRRGRLGNGRRKVRGGLQRETLGEQEPGIPGQGGEQAERAMRALRGYGRRSDAGADPARIGCGLGGGVAAKLMLRGLGDALSGVPSQNSRARKTRRTGSVRGMRALRRRVPDAVMATVAEEAASGGTAPEERRSSSHRATPAAWSVADRQRVWLFAGGICWGST